MTLIDQLKKDNRRSDGRHSVLVNRDDIREAMDQGYTVKAIWEALRQQGKVSISYQQFRLHVKKLIRQPAPVTVTEPAPASGPTALPENSSGPIMNRPEAKTYKHDPVTPDKDNLI